MNASIPACKKKGEYLKSDKGLDPDCPLRKNPVLIVLKENNK
jgi:hypothetical protein